MKIAQVAPIWHNLPPKLYGGTERIVSDLTEGLVKNGHEVSLFATKNSQTSATLIPTVENSLYEQGVPWSSISYPLYHITTVFDHAYEFDIIHMHLNIGSDFISFPLTVRCKTPVVFTLHFSIKTAEQDLCIGNRPVLMKYKELNFISISNSQRTLPLHYLKTVYNGINLDTYSFQEKPLENYLLWVGRVSDIKGTKEAIESALETNTKLIIAGKVDKQDTKSQEYYNSSIASHIDAERIVFNGELEREELVDLYKNAGAMLFPIKWEEPFGLVMIEAMACGTPVIAFARGSVPEVVRDGITGFIINSSPNDVRGDWIIKKTGVEGLVEAINRIGEIDRASCRKHVEENFTVARMVDGYEQAYQQVLSAK